MRDEIREKLKANAIRDIGNLINVKYKLGDKGKIKVIAVNDILETPEYKGFKEKYPSLCRMVEDFGK